MQNSASNRWDELFAFEHSLAITYVLDGVCILVRDRTLTASLLKLEIHGKLKALLSEALKAAEMPKWTDRLANAIYWSMANGIVIEDVAEPLQALASRSSDVILRRTVLAVADMKPRPLDAPQSPELELEPVTSPIHAPSPVGRLQAAVSLTPEVLKAMAPGFDEPEENEDEAPPMTPMEATLDCGAEAISDPVEEPGRTERAHTVEIQEQEAQFEVEDETESESEPDEPDTNTDTTRSGSEDEEEGEIVQDEVEEQEDHAVEADADPEVETEEPAEPEVEQPSEEAAEEAVTSEDAPAADVDPYEESATEDM
ncbi:retinal rod [Carpediemonas membranifera]|uniref:Retinal rod n=1 Tax=Carpediemonas membranifera TaxID=201153 RepID=A0A8J6EAP6_9EUKA|nr:retinal rod [Carpediemonas membranifera]|eukprot:KAG9395020.1 retinal rod [Carpediemonas membranifera]